jgi:small-conductance mechanosensitive channel
MNSRIIVPNSVINKELIENSSFINQRASAFVDVIITYDSDLDLAREIIARVVTGHPDFDDPRTPEQIQQGAPKTRVFVRNLGLYGIELRASMWTCHVNVNFGACSDVRCGILREFEAAGIRLASSKFIDPLIQRPN